MTPTDDKKPPVFGPAGATPRGEEGRVCPACGTKNTFGSRFCGGCAAPLNETPDGPLLTSTRTVLAPTVDLSRGSRLADRYEIIEELGRGGMGKVYKAYDHKVGEVIALKLIRPEISAQDKAIERFKNELKFTRKIAHRNVCRMFDLGDAGCIFYITMEFVAGEDLKRFVRRAGPLNAAKAVAIAGQVCDGLAEAHRIGAVHRDLKPQNIMIDAEGNAKVMDFGIARFTEMDRMTGSGVMIGTPEYMSPEQADLADVDPRSDLYSLGVVLFEMVAGRVPFEGPTPLSLAMKHKMERPKNVRELNSMVPAGLAEVIARCLEKNPENRFQSAPELRAALDRVERELGTAERAILDKSTKTKAIRAKKEKPDGKEKQLLPLAAAGILVAAAAGAYFLFLRPTPISPPSTEVNPAADTGAVEHSPAGEPKAAPPESKLEAGAETKLQAPESKVETGKPVSSGAGEQAAAVKPPPAGQKIETKTAEAETKTEAKAEPAKPKPAEPEEIKPEPKPGTSKDEPVEAPPEAKPAESKVAEADRVSMFAAQSRTVVARNKAVASGFGPAALFFSAAERAQQDAAVAVAESRVADAECWFAVAEALYVLGPDEGSDRARWRAFLKRIDGLRERALAAWNNVEGDPLFAEAKVRAGRGEAARKADRPGDALREYASAAFAYERILWAAELTKKK
ncbi:MAG: protein kinase [Candidatus Aminicenantes bacterium]|nr:protein kinase [Candidatus Aminicenantes bacterium]